MGYRNDSFFFHTNPYILNADARRCSYFELGLPVYKLGFGTNDLCTFCDNQPESLTHLFYHCSRSKQFWTEFKLCWCLISNQRIRLCLENVLFGILTENDCSSLQLLKYFIIIGKLYLWDCRSKQILPNIYGFRAKIIAKYEIEEFVNSSPEFQLLLKKQNQIETCFRSFFSLLNILKRAELATAVHRSSASYEKDFSNVSTYSLPQLD